MVKIYQIMLIIASFNEPYYQGIHSHQQAILGYLEFLHRIAQCNHWASDPQSKNWNPC